MLERVRLDDSRAVGLMATGLPPDASPARADGSCRPGSIELCFQTAGILEVRNRETLGLPTAAAQGDRCSPVSTNRRRAVGSTPRSGSEREALTSTTRGSCLEGRRLRRASGLPNDRLARQAHACLKSCRAWWCAGGSGISVWLTCHPGPMRNRGCAARSAPSLHRSGSERCYDWLRGRIALKALVATMVERAARGVDPFHRPRASIVTRPVRLTSRRSGATGTTRLRRRCPFRSRPSHWLRARLWPLPGDTRPRRQGGRSRSAPMRS